MIEMLRTRIGRRLLFAFLPVSLLPLIAATWIAVYDARVSIHRQGVLRLMADGGEAQVLEFLGQLKRRTLDLGSDGFVRERLESLGRGKAAAPDVAAKLSAYLEAEKLPLVPEAVEVFVADPSGRVVASSLPVRLGEDHSQRDYFLRARGGVHVGDLFRDPATGEIAWVVAAPVRDPASNAVLGIAGHRIDPKTLSDITTGRRATALGARTQSMRVGETGETYLVNRDKLMITESRFLDGAVLRVVCDTQPVRLALEKGEEMAGDYPDYRGVPISGASMIVEETGWVLLSEIDSSEVFAPAGRLRDRLAGLAAGWSLFVLLVAAYLAARIVRPVRRMVVANAAGVRGDIGGALIPEAGIDGDEIGDVIRTRNVMLMRLAEAGQVFESMLDAVVVANPDGRVRTMNRAALELLGYAAAEVAGQPIGSFLEEAGQFFRGAGLVALVRDGAAREVEGAFLTRGGERVPVVFDGSVIGGAEGRPLAIVGVARDMRPLQRLVREAEARAAELAALNAVVTAINESADLHAVLASALERIVTLLAVDGAECHLADAEGVLGWATAHGLDSGFVAGSRALRFPANAGIPGRAFASRLPVYVADAPRDQRYLRQELARAAGYRSLLCVPILWRETPLGTFMLYNREAREFTADALALLTTIGRQLAVAIERARLHEQVRAQRIAEREGLYRLSLDLAGVVEPGEVCRRVTAAAAQALGAAWCLVADFDDEKSEVRGRAPAHGLPDEAAAAIRCGVDDEFLAVWDIARAPHFVAPETGRLPASLRQAAGRTGLRSLVAARIFAAGRPGGVLFAADKKAGPFDDDDARLLAAYAQQAGLALERARLFEAERGQSRRLDAIGQVVQQVSTSLDLDELLQRAVTLVQQVFGYSHVDLLLADPSADEIVLRASAAAAGRRLREGYRLKVGQEGITGWVAASGRPLLVGDVECEPRYRVVPELAGTRSELAVPIARGGRVLGVLDVQSAQRAAFGRSDQDMLQAFAGHLAVAIENAGLFEAEQTRRTELAALYDLSRDLADAGHDRDAIVDLVSRHAAKTVRVTFARVALLDGDQLVLCAPCPLRVLGGDAGAGRREPVADYPLCRRVMEQDAPFVGGADCPEAGEQERARLFLRLARTVCLVPLRVDHRALGLLILGEARREERETFTPEKVRLARSIADQASSALQRAGLFAELEQAYLQTVLVLANAVDAKDTYTADHAQRLAVLALAVGRDLGLGGPELEDLRYGAILHDIGKIGVADAILKKRAPLDAEEWVEMRQHPVIGGQILAAVPRLAGAAQIVRHHHERYDGKGYPDGLAGEAIPLAARIVTVVDTYGAIMDGRVYKAARPQEDAVAELKAHARTQFDPRVVEAFLRLLERGGLGEAR